MTPHRFSATRRTCASTVRSYGRSFRPTMQHSAKIARSIGRSLHLHPTVFRRHLPAPRPLAVLGPHCHTHRPGRLSNLNSALAILSAASARAMLVRTVRPDRVGRRTVSEYAPRATASGHGSGSVVCARDAWLPGLSLAQMAVPGPVARRERHDRGGQKRMWIRNRVSSCDDDSVFLRR
jgi:hypothetical protein